MSEHRLSVELLPGGVATVVFERPPANYFDVALIAAIADAYATLNADRACRAIVLASDGRHFCTGADFGDGDQVPGRELYATSVRLYEGDLPVVVAVQGKAIGGGLGLALTGDFRVVGSGASFVCNFARLGLHHGFGLTVTLPALVGQQRALELLYTGGSFDSARALELGLCDRVVPDSDLRAAAIAFAGELAGSAPLAVRAIRRTMRGGLPDAIRSAAAVELDNQLALLPTNDFAEGVRAAQERRPPEFTAS